MYNKAFKSDSQRLAVSLRSSIAKRRSHLNAALCLIPQNQWVMVFFVPSAGCFCAYRQVGFIGCCFLDTYSLALKIQSVASVNFRVSARLGKLAQSKL